ncbi:hypothetical protein C3L33_19373, partial [Rhododendron williamsianum]
MMDDWRIRPKSRFHIPPGIFFKKGDDDEDRERYSEDPPMFRCSFSPALPKLLSAMILLSILFTSTAPSFQPLELGHLRLWRWQLVAFFAFYGRFISRAITTRVLQVIENANNARLKGNLPHAYAVKRTFEYVLSFATLLTTWILLIDTPLKKLGKRNIELENITKTLSCVVVLTAKLFGTNQRGRLCSVHLAYHVNSVKGSKSEDRGGRGYRRCCPEQSKGTQAFTGPNDLLSMASHEMLRLLPHRRSTRPNLNPWDDKAMSVSEEMIKKVSKSESREISLEDLSYCMPKEVAKEALKRIGATEGKFEIDELFIWVSHTFQRHIGLESSLGDTHLVLRDLHCAVSNVVLAILTFAWLVILDTIYVLPKNKELGHKFYMVILLLALVVARVFHVVWNMYGDRCSETFEERKRLQFPTDIGHFSVKSSCNGVLCLLRSHYIAVHWTARKTTSCDDDDDDGSALLIVSFHLADEVLREIRLPRYHCAHRDPYRKYGFISVIHGKLAFTIDRGDENSRDQEVWEVWLLEDYDNEESWTKFRTITMVPTCRQHIVPLQFLNDGEFVVCSGKGGLIVFDPTGQQIVGKELHGSRFEVVNYTQSLVLVKEGIDGSSTEMSSFAKELEELEDEKKEEEKRERLEYEKMRKEEEKRRKEEEEKELAQLGIARRVIKGVMEFFKEIGDDSD